MKGWLDNFGKADNANDSNVSLPEGFVGLGYNTKGRNYSPAWGGQFEEGGIIPSAQRGKKIDEILNANKNLDWVKGLYDPNYGSIQIPGQEGRSTHFMESADRRVYPTIRKIDGELIYLGDDAYDYADSTKSYIEFPTDKKAQKFAKNYKRGTGVLDFQHGGSIPGSVGFTYARVAGAAPSKGKYAKKTMASAQNGIIADKIAGLELKMSPEYQRLKYLQSLPQLRQAPGRGEELVREGLATADIATDLMQVGNFIPHPMAQGVGKAGNILGSGVDLAQALMSARQGDYLDAAINLGSVGLAGGLASSTFRRNSKYLQPGQPLYALSPQAFGSLSRTNYIEPFRKVGKMTDKNLLANRALLGLIGAETVYDAMPQTSSSNVISSSDIEGVYPSDIELTYPKSQPLPTKTKNVSSAETAKRLADYMNSKSGEKTGEVYGRKSYYPIDGFENGGEMPSAQNGEENIKTIDLPEIVVTPYDEQYPFYQSLSNEQKKYINDEGPIGRATRALAKTGKRGQTAKDISKVVKDVEKLGAEFTGIPGTIRFAEDPVKSLKGAGKTLLDLGLMSSTPLAPITAPITYGALDGMNPITEEQLFNQQNLQGAFDTLDALGMVGGAAALLKQPVQKGFQQGAKKTVGNIVNRSITPIGYDPFTVAAAPLELITPNALKFKPKTYATKNRFDAWRLYNGLDPEFNTFSKNPDGTLAINDFRLGKDDLEEIVNNPKESFGTMEVRREFNFGGVHGNGWITKGVDEEGRKFIDFTDTWDIQPFAAFSKLPERIRNFEVSSLSGGKPFDLKNRIYYDDKGNFFDHSGNKLVEEVQHFPKGVAKENEAADIPMLSTPNVVGTKQTDVLKDWNNATNHKFIKGGLTSGIGVASGASYLAARAAKKRLKEDEKKGDDTVKEFQNGGEMRFYQNGLDWKPKSMQDGGVQRISTSDPRYPELYKNRQVGAYYDGAFTLPDLPEVTVTAPRSYTMDSLRDFTTAALYGAPANAMKLSMIPQAAMTEGIEALRGEPYDFSNVNPNFGGFTSNQRDLSQTMGYENPEGFLQNAVNFGLSAIDPMILSGASKVVGKQLARKAVPEFIPEKIVFDLMDESIDPFAQVLKNIKIHDTPSPFAKDVQKEAFKYQKLARDPRYLERVKNIDRDFGSRLEPLLNEFKNDEIQNVNQYFPFNISIVDEIPHSFGGEPVDVLGISGLNTEGSLKNAMNKGVKYPQKITPSTDRYIEINEPRHLRENAPARGTVHHELKHHWTNALLDAENKNYEQALRNLIARRSEAGIDPRDVAANQDYNYLSRGTEVDAHLMTNLRDEMVKRGYLKDHFDELSEGKLNDFLSKEKDYRGVREYFNPLKPMVTDKSKFVDFFNKYGLPSTVIGGVLGGQAIDQQKNGGITKDNQGYWNPENWGKPVEIDSNNITMEGVNQPLLGISDTGDTKLMKPGKNYKFKGKKVTEFPVAQNGSKLSKEEVDDVKNFIINYHKSPMFKQRVMSYDTENIKKFDDIKKLDESVGYLFRESEKNPDQQKYLNKSLLENLAKSSVMKSNLDDTYEKYYSPQLGPISSAKVYQSNEQDGYSSYNPVGNEINLNLGNTDVEGLNPSNLEKLAHEYSHAVSTFNKSKIAPPKIRKEVRGYMKNINDSHDADFIETKADIDAVRYLLNKENIYDASREEFTKEHLDRANDKLKDSALFKRLKRIYGNDESKLIYLMNTIASNKEEQIPVAKLGINQLDAQPMKKLNQLLNFTNNPDKDNWLDKYN